MLRYCLAGSLLFALGLMGCQSATTTTDAPAASHPVTPAEFNRIRDAYQHEDPNARVGMVTAVEPSAMLAAIEKVNVSDFKTGDVVSFIDSARHTVANGLVETIADNRLLVRYQTPAGGRAPQVGDLAIRAIK